MPPSGNSSSALIFIMRKKIIYFISIISIVTAVGCTKAVYENRDECPCLLTLDLSGVNRNMDTLFMWLYNKEDGNIILRDTIYANNLISNYTIEVPRRELGLYVWTAEKWQATVRQDYGMIDASLNKLRSLQADSLYHYRDSFSTRDMEEWRDTVVLHREFFTVKVVLKGNSTPENPLDVNMHCNSVGYYIDGVVKRGGSHIIAPMIINAEHTDFVFRMYRQSLEEELMLVINGLHKDQPYVFAEIDFGKHLRSINYDMQGDLKDVLLEYDMSSGFITVTIKNWGVTDDTDIIL